MSQRILLAGLVLVAVLGFARMSDLEALEGLVE